MTMDATLVVAGGVVGAHGLGHVLGWLPAWGLAKFEGVSSASWLVGGLGETAERAIAGAMFLAPTAGFVAAAAAMFTGHGWFRGVALTSAAVSLAATAIFPRAFPLGSTVGSVAVNLAVLAGLLLTSWEPATIG